MAPINEHDKLWTSHKQQQLIINAAFDTSNMPLCGEGRWVIFCVRIQQSALMMFHVKMHAWNRTSKYLPFYRSFSYQNQLRGWILATHIYENAMRLLYLPISMNGSQIMIHEGFRPDAEVKIFGMNCLFVWHWCAAKPPMAFFREDNNTSPLSICSINL